MVEFILGHAGSGKTAELRRRIRGLAREKQRVILLVPEQFSFESERLLHRDLGAIDSRQVEVYSFTRLCNAIFRALGGLAGVPVNPAARYALMSLAVSQMQDQLQSYRKSARNTAFLTTLLETCAEFKEAGIAPRELDQAAENCRQQELRGKLKDLAGIYEMYQGMLRAGYTDPEDDMARACALLESNDFFAGAHLFVDGFFTFLTGEFEMLGHAVAQAESVTFALPADSAEDSRQGMGIFSPVQEAIVRIRRMAKKAGVPVAEPLILQLPRRYTVPELAFLAREYPAVQPKVYDEKCGAVQIACGESIYREVERCATEIARLVRQEGYRYREIGVICRDPQPYERAMRLFFARYEIPFFAAARRDVENAPLVSAVLMALEAIQRNFEQHAMLRLAKNPVFGFDALQTALLENYCYCWNMRGALWLEEWKNNPRGMDERFTEQDAQELQTVNALRARLVEPLLQLRGHFRAGTGRRFAQGIYAFLQQIDAPGALRRWSQQLAPALQKTTMDENAQLWDLLMEILDVFGLVLGEEALAPAQLNELLHMALARAEIATPPQTLDQVIVGAADRIRPEGMRAVFVLGANEGVFPPQLGARGVFSDEERTALIDAGLQVGAPRHKQEALERFYCYFALTLASDRLYVSCAGSDLKGAELFASPMMIRLQAMFPQAGWPPEEMLDTIAGEISARSALAAQYRTGSEFAASLAEYFAAGDSGDILEKLERARQKQPHQMTSRELTRQLFGEKLRLSPTGIERYSRCPFSYFARDGLKLDKRKRAEFNPLESGSVIHYVMQVMVQRHGGAGLAGLPDEQLHRETAEIIREYLELRVQNMQELPARMRHLFNSLCLTLTRLLRHLGEEFAQSRFVPVAFELPIRQGEDTGVNPLWLRNPEGGWVTVEGIVDRVDVMEKNGKRYVRVVDYKSGKKDFRLEDVLSGLNMQMLLYLFTIEENGKDTLAQAEPAGVLYMPLHESYLPAERSEDAEQAGKKRTKQRTMSGLVLDDEEVIYGMEAAAAGVYIPVKIGKNGPDARSALATRADMGRLAHKVKEQVAGIAEALAKGQIAAWPVDSADYPACQYCDYRTVCGYEAEDPVREIAKMDRKAFFAMLEKEEMEHIGG
jgi:ATP-dependent nuclease, subunit B